VRIGPRHPWLGTLGFQLALNFIDRACRSRHIVRANSAPARARIAAIRDKIAGGQTAYLAGVSASGAHNTGIALIEVTRDGPHLLFNNEEERFSAVKHTNKFPTLSIDALRDEMGRRDLDIRTIDGWFSAWDHAALSATLIRAALEEAPQTLRMLSGEPTGLFNMRAIDSGIRSARHIGKQLGMSEPPLLIGTAHHDNHAWFSFAASPFARVPGPTMVAVIDGLGDVGSISLYVCEDGRMRLLYCNDSVFDSLGLYYAVISSTQGGWTWLSSEGRYMGATAYGNNDRASNPYYAALKDIFVLQKDGRVALNRDLANWPRSIVREPYTEALIRILGEPIPADKMWNPDAVLRIEDIKHPESTRARLDKAAACQMVFEDAIFHIVDHFICLTGSERLVLTGGVGLNALANMRLLEHFDQDYFRREHGLTGRLHMWVPPTPNDAGVPIGAAYMGAYLAGYGLGPPITHAFYCGAPPAAADIRAALQGSDDVDWIELAAADDTTRDRYADFMAYMTAQDAIFALYQGAAETGPRALGHRSILANPCNPKTRENLNARVKYREAIRPLAPMMTLEAAQQLFDLSDGASDADYNAYNYMVLTAHAKPEAKSRIPSVVHADGTGRLQIVREETDPLTYAYLKALGRRIGVEVGVNTSFNVAGPIAQTPTQALATLRRSKGLDAVLMFSAEGPVFAALHRGTGGEGGARFRQWLADWQAATGKRLET
jgi:carbamoyltransferase